MTTIELKVGESICSPGNETVISVWLVDDGSEVSEGTVICEFMTEKVIAEFAAPCAGRIEMLVEPEQPLQFGDVFARVINE